MKALIVYDNQKVSQWVGSVFEDHDWVVTIEASNLDVLPKMVKEQYDAVIIPVLGDVMSGLQTLLAVQQITPDVRIILIGETITAPLEDEAMKKGAFAFLNIPFRTEDIEDLIYRLEQQTT